MFSLTVFRIADRDDDKKHLDFGQFYYCFEIPYRECTPLLLTP